VRRASSPWRMAGGADGALMSELAKGAAQAVRETGAVASARIESWLAARLDASAPARACEIGHEDVFALPR
jgi:hypothetical protein